MTFIASHVSSPNISILRCAVLCVTAYSLWLIMYSRATNASKLKQLRKTTLKQVSLFQDFLQSLPCANLYYKTTPGEENLFLSELTSPGNHLWGWHLPSSDLCASHFPLALQ